MPPAAKAADKGYGDRPIPLSFMEVTMTVSVFLAGCCRLVTGTFDAVFSEPLLAFFLTVLVMAVAAGLFLYIYRRAKRF